MDARLDLHPSQARRAAMLRTAFCETVRSALSASDTIEIMANPDGSIWIERAGRGVEKSEHALAACDRERVIRLVASASLETSQTGIVSAELPGSGERFEGILPPIATAPCFSIRKPSPAPFSLGDYVCQGALSKPLCAALRRSISMRDNIVIAGGTSSGKTSFANALLAEPAFAEERVVILEDTRELRSEGQNCVRLKTHASGSDMRALVRSTLRLRPDRIVVGEVRGAEALDLLKAWNTGHPGGVTTLHANSAPGALTRLEHLALEAVSSPSQNLIAEAVNVVLFMARRGEKRVIEAALRVTGFEDGTYCTQPLCAPALISNLQGRK